MNTFESSSRTGSFLRRDENSEAKNNFLSKINQLDELLARLTKQLQQLQLECSSVRSQKQSVQQFLARRSEQTKQSLLQQLACLDQEMLKNVQDNQAQSRQLSDRIVRLKEVQLHCQKSVLGLQRRIHELEVQIGI